MEERLHRHEPHALAVHRDRVAAEEAAQQRMTDAAAFAAALPRPAPPCDERSGSCSAKGDGEGTRANAGITLSSNSASWSKATAKTPRPSSVSRQRPTKARLKVAVTSASASMAASPAVPDSMNAGRHAHPARERNGTACAPGLTLGASSQPSAQSRVGGEVYGV